MTRNEFIKLLKDNLKPNAQMDFLICDYKKNQWLHFQTLKMCA